MLATLLGFLGLLVGGAANHIGAALVSDSRSAALRCDYCGSARPWVHWLALPALVIRRDRCASCGAPLPMQNALIEVGLGVTFAYASIVLSPWLRLALTLAYSSVFALVLATDLASRRIPDIIIMPAIGLATAAAFFTPGLESRSALLGGLMGFSVYLLIALVGRLAYGTGAMGAGDVKLATFTGLILGYPLVTVSIVVAILSAGLVSLVLVVTRLRGRRDPIPYAPFLVAGVAVAALWGSFIIGAFLR